MATTGRRNGTLNALYLAGTKMTYLTVNSFTINGATIDVSSKDDAGWKATLAGQLSFGFSCTCQYAEDAAVGFTSLHTSMVARSSVAITVKTSVSGDKIYGGTCRITSLSQSDENEGASTFSVDFEGTGAATVTT